jgi:hypothetical protein
MPDIFGYLVGIEVRCNWYLHNINIFLYKKILHGKTLLSIYPIIETKKTKLADGGCRHPWCCDPLVCSQVRSFSAATCTGVAVTFHETRWWVAGAHRPWRWLIASVSFSRGSNPRPIFRVIPVRASLSWHDACRVKVFHGWFYMSTIVGETCIIQTNCMW